MDKQKTYLATTLSGREYELDDPGCYRTDQGDFSPDKIKAATHKLGVVINMKDLPNDGNVLILTAEQFAEKVRRLGVKESVINKYTTELVDAGILPLYSGSYNAVLLARMLGFLQGDGHLGFTVEDYPRTHWTFGREQDAIDFNNDVEKLNISSNKITENTAFYTSSQTTHHTWDVHKYKGFSALMMALDGVIGRKTETASIPIPDWIMNGSPLIKREFISGFAGADGCRINSAIRHYPSGDNKTYDMSPMVQHKVPEHVDSSEEWFLQLKQLFDDFGINTGRILTKDTVEERYQGKYKVCLEFSSSGDNMKNYMNIIGYRYCQTKYMESLLISEWLLYRDILLLEIAEKRKRVYELYKTTSMSFPAIDRAMGLLNGQAQRFFHAYEENKGVNWPEGNKQALKLIKWLDTVSYQDQFIYLPIKSITEL